MSNRLAATEIATSRTDVNRRLRLLREGQCPALPTGWGRWPTFTCASGVQSADGSHS